MKKVLFILLTVLSLSASAQKIIFTDQRNHWITHGTVGAEACPFADYMNYSTDTVEYLQTYKQLICNSISPYPRPGCMGGGAGGMYSFNLIREDTIANIVYYRDPNTDTLEHILYNYNLHVGDTIRYPISYYSTTLGYMLPVVDSVVHIDSTLINGVYHKVFTMQGRNDSFPHSTGGLYRAYTLIEGMGCTVSPEFPALFTGCFEYNEKLLCFQQDTVLPVINTPYYLCAVGFPSSPDSFHNGLGNCNPMSVNNIQKSIPSLTIYPNPVTTELTITSSSTVTFITITNLIGQTLFTQPCNSALVQVDVSNLPKGLYFIKINGTEVRKFVKE